MSSFFSLTLITSTKSHLWMDALHARALAHQTHDDWNRGTYVRWAITTAWTVIELCCRDALTTEKIGRRFKEDVNRAIDDNGYERIDWSCGIWQRVLELQGKRTDFVHLLIDQDKLWPDTSEADYAVNTARESIKDIYRISGKQFPEWIDINSADGWS